MEEYIGKVKLNLDFYKGTDTYSDGDIEDKLLEVVKNGTDLEEFLTTESEWPYLYYFSNIRHNILEWYDFGEGRSLLEIGAGCGAVTGLFCEKLDRVVAIDLSKRRSSINAYRNQKYDNLEIMVGNFQDIETDEKFDYVTLIGVLEYSIYYIGSDDPFRDMLRRAKNYLKPGGKLIIAIENKYGIKYWAGSREENTGLVPERTTQAVCLMESKDMMGLIELEPSLDMDLRSWSKSLVLLTQSSTILCQTTRCQLRYIPKKDFRREEVSRIHLQLMIEIDLSYSVK